MTKHGELNYCIENGFLKKIEKITNNPKFNKTSYNSYFSGAIEFNQVGSVKILLESLKITPENHENYFINKAFIEKKYDIVDLFWNDSRVRNTLKNDQPELYTYLFHKDLKNKINEF